jgi:hypothetical protein
MQPTDPSTTRRLLIGGSIATLGGAVSLATAGPALAADGDGRFSSGGNVSPTADAPAALPVLAVAEQALYFGPLGWAVYAAAAGASVIYQFGAGSRASSGWLGQSIPVPAGSTITGLDLTLRGTAPISGLCTLTRTEPDVSGSWTQNDIVTGSAVGTTSITTLQPVTAATSYSLEVFTNATTYVTGVRVRYTPPVPSGLNLVPITPARVYDSRRSMTPDANGAISTGANRTISVANGRNPSTGTVTLPNVVPATATAIAYTLTVTGSSAGGYLAVNPGGDTVVHASTINWAAGQTLANSGVIAISPTRTITVVGGSGTTQFIVDVIGYYVA